MQYVTEQGLLVSSAKSRVHWALLWFCFCKNFTSADAADAALALNGQDLAGCSIHVSIAK